MIKKIKSYLLISASTLMLLAPVAITATIGYASAACTHTADQIAKGASQAATGADGNVTCDATGTGTGGIEALAANIVNIFSIVVGIVAVIMIIYGGFRYITSGGDSGSVGNAKNTLIYAIVGLIIVALAQVIVHFVLTATNTVSSANVN